MAPLIPVTTWHFGTAAFTTTSTSSTISLGSRILIFLPCTSVSMILEAPRDSSTISAPLFRHIRSTPRPRNAFDVRKIGRSDSPMSTLAARSLRRGKSPERNSGEVTTPGLNTGHVKFGLTKTVESRLTRSVQPIHSRALEIVWFREP